MNHDRPAPTPSPTKIPVTLLTDAQKISAKHNLESSRSMPTTHLRLLPGLPETTPTDQIAAATDALTGIDIDIGTTDQIILYHNTQITAVKDRLLFLKKQHEEHQKRLVFWQTQHRELVRLQLELTRSDDHARHETIATEQTRVDAERRTDRHSIELAQAKRIKDHVYARMHGWREVWKSISTALTDEDRIAVEQDLANTITAKINTFQLALITAYHQRHHSAALVTRGQHRVSVIQSVLTGIDQFGFSRYLTRASEAEQTLIHEVRDDLQKQGAVHLGRRPATHNDVTKTAAKVLRATKARERRARQAQEYVLSATNEEEQEAHRTRHREKRRRDRDAAQISAASFDPDVRSINPSCDGSQPVRRQHEERLALLAPDERVTYQARLRRARERGHAAALHDAALRQACWPMLPYHAPHPAIPLGRGARLIAVRGGDANALALAMSRDSNALESWLAEPSAKRLIAMGKRARLQHVAGHLVAAWSPTLSIAAQNGVLDEALAHEVDRLVARLDLVGHRVTAVLHLDSISRHPHLHILFARVNETDSSLWSLDGRERAPALWLHARANTALAGGKSALDHDVDALAGPGEAAVTGELLMASHRLAATRHSVDGQTTRIPLQGPEAARRIAEVGTLHGALAGGIWKFGLGVDQQAQRQWQIAMQEAHQRGDQEMMAKAQQSRPLSRGYWLRPVDVAPTGSEWLFRSGYGWYLSRQGSGHRSG